MSEFPWQVENPDTLKQRQQVQQNKSIHELSKIGNVNQIPLPFKVPLPDIPLPKIGGIFKSSSSKNKRAQQQQQQQQQSQSPVDPMMGYEAFTPGSLSPDRTGEDFDALRYEASSVEGELSHREQDFGYEIIEEEERRRQREMEAEEAAAREAISQKWEEDEERHAAAEQETLDVQQYRGTPERKIPSRSKRGRFRQSQEHVEVHLELKDPFTIC